MKDYKKIMDKDIELIMNHPLDAVVRLILERLDDWQLSRIRGALEPHWSDGMYGKWSYTDPLLKEVYIDSGKDWVNSKNIYSGYVERDFVNISECKLCGEALINDARFTNSFYNHLFANCKIAGELMKISKSEDEFREKVSQIVRFNNIRENGKTLEDNSWQWPDCIIEEAEDE